MEMAFPVTTGNIGRTASPAAISSTQASSEAVLMLPSLQLLAANISRAYEEGKQSPDLQAILHPQIPDLHTLTDGRGGAVFNISTDAVFSEEKSGLKPETPKPAKKKTGRKPSTFSCFLCPKVLPYKYALISHLQTEHAINRSQSLMYKRVNQGGDEIRRLYCRDYSVIEERLGE